MAEHPQPFAARFRYTSSMVRHLMACAGAQQLIDHIPLPPSAEVYLVTQARLNSTKHSTEIEGNTLSKQEIRIAVASAGRGQSEQELEVRNYWRALEWLEEQADAEVALTEQFVRRLHAIIDTTASGRKARESEYREATVAVNDSTTGQPVYIAPASEEVHALVADLVRWNDSPAAAVLPAPIRAALVAHRFLTIHPFRDGNGRTARALATYVLWANGFRMRGFLSVEEQYAVRRSEYYAAIQMGLPVLCYTANADRNSRLDPDHTEWLEFFCRTIASACAALVERALPWIEDTLGPGRDSEWTQLGRRQKSVLVRLLGTEPGDDDAQTVDSAKVTEWFGVSRPTALDWLREWESQGFVVASGAGRSRRFQLSERWLEIGVRLLRPRGRRLGSDH